MKLSTLEQLRLTENSLTTLEAGFFNGLSNPERLYLDENQITIIIPGSFSGLSSLQRLDLDQNWLTILGPGLFQGLLSLRRLIVSNNRMSSLEVFANLTSLCWLRLDPNELTTIEFFRTGLSDAFLSDYLTYLKLHSTKTILSKIASRGV